MHAFTVNDALKLSDGTKLIRIRNPWGSEWYDGPWSDKSIMWTEKYKKEAGYVDGNDGLWFISDSDYLKSMEFTTYNKSVSGMHHSHFAIFDRELGKDHSDQLKLKSKVDQTVYISAYLYD